VTIVWILIVVLSCAAGIMAGSVVTLRRLPVIISRMSSTDRERLLDQVEAAERGTD
jgi:hypothetical protein